MIVNLVVNILLAPIQALLDLLGTAGSLGLNTAATNVVSALPPLGWLNDYMPVTQMLEAVTAIIGTLAVMLIINLGLWVYHQFWGNN